MIEIPQAQIGVHLPELLPAGEHVFSLEPPHYLHNLLEYPYLTMAMFQVNRPTGGFSWNPITRRLYYWRLRKQISKLMAAVQWLERNIESWKVTPTATRPWLIAQAEDLLKYMREEILSTELYAIFDAVKVITPGAPWEKLNLFTWGVDLLTYADPLRERSYRRISKSERFIIEVRLTNVDSLMEIIAQRLDMPVNTLADWLRCVVYDWTTGC